MKRFLLTTDFSPACDHSLDFMIKVLEGKNIALDMLHVFDIPLIDPSQIPREAVEGMIADYEERGKKKLQEKMKRVPDKNKGRLHAIFGVYPSTEIAEFVNERKIDLVIMAMRKKYGLLDRMIGSITAHTIHKSTVPLLAIPAESVFKGFSNILVPSSTNLFEELTEKEEEALDWLSNFWELFSNPLIHLLHVKKDQNKEKLDITFNKSPYSTMKYSISYAPSVHDGIMNFISERNPDILAFYKPNRSFWERLYHRSDTKALLYELKMPILIFS